MRLNASLDYSEAEYTLALISAIYQTNTELPNGMFRSLDTENVAFSYHIFKKKITQARDDYY